MIDRENGFFNAKKAIVQFDSVVRRTLGMTFGKECRLIVIIREPSHLVFTFDKLERGRGKIICP